MDQQNLDHFGPASPRGLRGSAAEAPRLLIVAREMTRGGAAYLALRHVRELSRSFRIDVLVTGLQDDEFLGEFPPGVEFHRLQAPHLRFGGPPRDVCHRLALDNPHTAPFQREYDAVLATSVFPDPVACAVTCTVRAGRRLVFLVDESLATCGHYLDHERVMITRCLETADLVLPVSRRLWHVLADRFPPLRDRPWRPLRPPVDRDAISRVGPEAQDVIRAGGVPSVLTIARLTPDKQVGPSVQIHRWLKDAGVDFRWYVIGVGEEEPAIRALIVELGMEQDFILLGRRDDVYAILQACDVLALISRSEGCPTVVLEALAANRPVLMTDVNGADELLEGGRLGTIVANEPWPIFHALARIVRDEGLRGDYRRNQAERAALGAEADGAGSIVDVLATVAPVVPPDPLVSILIPASNQVGSIGRAVRSVLDQDLAAVEVIVLDDASTDGTGPAARAWWADPRVRYIGSERALGRVANYRRGLVEHARGEWVLLLDGNDHLVDPTFLRETLEAVRRAASWPVVFAQAGHQLVFADGRQDVAVVLPPIYGPEEVVPGAEYLRLLFESGFAMRSGTLIRREAALAADFFAADIRSTVLDSLQRLALDGDVLVLNRVAGCCIEPGAVASPTLPLDQIEENVRIFRTAATAAVRRGLMPAHRIEGLLTRHEARTLIELFDLVLGDAAPTRRQLIRFAAIAHAINPRLFRNAEFLAACRRYLGLLVRRQPRDPRTGPRADPPATHAPRPPHRTDAARVALPSPAHSLLLQGLRRAGRTVTPRLVRSILS